MKYIAVKTVDAVPMTAEDAVNYGYRIGDNNGDGYEVTYQEGYKSWCPKDVFEQHNIPFEEDSIASTLQGSISSDYKQRFIAEFKALNIRIQKLETMLDKQAKGTLEFKPTCPRDILCAQLTAMREYSSILTERARIESIEL